MPKTAPITAEYVNTILNYCPHTGVFTWRARTPDMFEAKNISAKARCNWWNKMYAGKQAGTVNRDGHVKINLNNGQIFGYYAAHRLAWLVTYGKFPEKDIDHKNGNPADNRIDNLREATVAQNQHNKKALARNKLGVKGVRFQDNRYLVTICYGKKSKHLGCYKTLEEAKDVYERAACELHGEFYYRKYR